MKWRAMPTTATRPPVGDGRLGAKMGGGSRHDRARAVARADPAPGLPPLAKDATTKERDPDYAVSVIGLLLYVAVVTGVLVLLDIE